MMDTSEFLIFLAKLGAVTRAVQISTPSLAKDLGIPQQTLSRWLCSLEREGLISRDITRRGQGISLTQGGKAKLKDIYHSLKTAFEGKPEGLLILGKVVTGLGEGKYYMSIPPYRKEMKKKLCFDPFLGTLNMKLNPENLSRREVLNSLKGISIEAHYFQGRKLLSAKCFPALISGKIKGAVIIPERTHHGEDILEVISPLNLRKALSLKDGQTVSVLVQT
jgi:riboflavin kinase